MYQSKYFSLNWETFVSGVALIPPERVHNWSGLPRYLFRVCGCCSSDGRPFWASFPVMICKLSNSLL